MNRPLCKSATLKPEKLDREGHAGLWFDKYCDAWHVNGDAWTLSSCTKNGKEINPKLDWINSVTKMEIGERHQLDKYALRLARLIEKRGGRADVFATESRFVTGLGRSHPVENGFAWHPTLGTPYLPGSSVKGMVRAWAKTEEKQALDQDSLKRLFGTPGGVGGICFLDAVPTISVRLEADVMTPHYAGWSADEPPGDWMSPTPIPFLATVAGTPFLFAIVSRGNVSEADLNLVSCLLRSALEWAGGGAKTAIGYGRFRHDEKQTRDFKQRLIDEDQRQREEQARKEAMRSPEGRWHLEIGKRSEAEVLDLVRIHLEKDPLEDSAERRAFANAVLSEYHNWVELWRVGNKHDKRTSVGKKKLKGRVLLLDSATTEVDPRAGGQAGE